MTQAGVAFCSEPPRHERDGQEAAEGCEGDGSRRELGLVAALVCEHDDHRADGHAECDSRDADERRREAAERRQQHVDDGGHDGEPHSGHRVEPAVREDAPPGDFCEVAAENQHGDWRRDVADKIAGVREDVWHLDAAEIDRDGEYGQQESRIPERPQLEGLALAAHEPQAVGIGEQVERHVDDGRVEDGLVAEERLHDGEPQELRIREDEHEIVGAALIRRDMQQRSAGMREERQQEVDGRAEPEEQQHRTGIGGLHAADRGDDEQRARDVDGKRRELADALMAEHRAISEHAAEQDEEPELCHRAIDMVQRISLQNEMGGEHEERQSQHRALEEDDEQAFHVDADICFDDDAADFRQIDDLDE